MTRRRHARHGGPPRPQVDAVRALLEAEAARHEPDRAAIYRMVLEATSERRTHVPGRALIRRRDHRARPTAAWPESGMVTRGIQWIALGKPKVVAGATAAVVIGVVVVTGALAFGGPPAQPSAATPTAPAPTAATLPTSGADGDGLTSSVTAPPTASTTQPPNATAVPRPQDGQVGDPLTQPGAAATSVPTGSAPQAGSAQPGSAGQAGTQAGGGAWFEIGRAAVWSAQARIELPATDTVDWALFGNGDKGVRVRSATRDRAIDVVAGPRRVDADSGFPNRFFWSGGTPDSRGTDYIDRLSLGSGESVELAVAGNPTRDRHLDLYLGSYSGSVRVVVSLGGERDERRVELPAGDLGRSADGVVTVSFRPSDSGSRLSVEVYGEDRDSRSSVTIAAAVLR